MCTECFIRYNMHSAVDKVPPHLGFEKSWISTLCLIFTYVITSYHRERKIWHRQVGPTSYVSSFPRNHPASPISRVRSTQHFFCAGVLYQSDVFFFLPPLPLRAVTFLAAFLSLQYIILLCVYVLSKKKCKLSKFVFVFRPKDIFFRFSN